ncbi:MAG: hypothetical protein GY820_13005 [Gammaproteobacteria bacterium]|nr:hypothetical protein [Gammaproteobacteria bacterium]
MNAESPGISYRLMSLMLLPFWLLHGFFHGRSHDLPSYLSQRTYSKPGDHGTPQVWIHASSVGEVVAMLPLVKALLAEGESILFTSFTATGYQTIQKYFPTRVQAGIAPIDFILISRYFIRRHNMKLCLLMETELWPELLFQTAQHNIPVIQVNARLSARSLKAPVFIRYLLRRAITSITLHLARSQQDRQALIEFGADDQNIKVTGNIKLYREDDEPTHRLIDQKYLLLASSHEGEEVLFVKHRLEKRSDYLIVIAPRHPKRSVTIQKQLMDMGIDLAVRSKHHSINRHTQVYLADTLGELRSFMAYADIVIMAGSFDHTGGHNIIEPAKLGCAIITGPSDSDISNDIEQLADGIIQVEDMPTCWQKIDYLLENPQQAKALGDRVRKSTQQQTGILDAYLAQIRPYL